MTALVFIADDNQADIDLITLAFEENGMQVDLTVANDGLRAIDLLESIQPTLVMLDIKMPGADGFEVLAWLRDQTRFRDVPVVVMSSSFADSDQQRALQLGASQFWSKPVRFYEMVEFVASLRRILER